MPPASSRITQDWQSYYNESLGISFRYSDTNTLLINDPINSGIQLKSDSTQILMIANPLSNKSIDMLAEELHGKGFKESDRIQIQKGFWKGLRLQGKVTKIGVPSVDEVVYMVKAPSGSIFTCLALSTAVTSDFAEVDMIWDSLSLQHDGFAMPPSLLSETPMNILQPKDQGYSLLYPQSWQAMAMSKGLTFVQDPNSPDTFMMTVSKSPTLDDNLDQSIERALDDLVVFNDVVLNSKQEVLISGAQDAVILLGSARFSDDSPAIFKTLLILTKDSTYKVEVVVEKTKWESLSATFDNIFNSFSLDIE